MKTAWMIRSGGRGAHMDLFESGIVGIGYDVPTDLSGTKTLADIKAIYAKMNPEDTASDAGGPCGSLHKFVHLMAEGDPVMTYDPHQRVYLIGRITSGYYFDATPDIPLRHRRRVEWGDKRVSRDDLKPATKNSMGTLLGVFQVNEDSWRDFEAALKGKKPADAVEQVTATKKELEEDKRTLQEQAHERLKDRIVLLDDMDMQELLAGVLRAMGFRTTVSPAGPDRGVDVLASPDGLGLQEPRIKCEVKHRKRTNIGSQDVRSFIGGLREGDKGLYLSTGGFTREAHYEAERANVPVKLLDLDALALLIETHYDSFDTEARALLPLTRIYWPAD